MKITVIPNKRADRKRRVAAYCRVSTRKNTQEESLDFQQSYYESQIRGCEEWEYVQVYFDDRTATSVDKRPGFQQMLRDALAGNVDLILCKSISRFSRNIVDCQKYARILKSNGVEILFDKEHISTFDPSAEMMFALMGSIAQSESQAISEHVRWGYRERFRRGEYHGGMIHALGYDAVDGKLTPNQDAWMVRLIYKLFLEGKSYRSIAEALTEAGAKPLQGGSHFSPSTVQGIVSNELYVGDKLLQKRPPVNCMTKRPDPSIPYERNYLKDDHQGIIDRATWAQAQALLARREGQRKQGVFIQGERSHVLYGKLFCGICGEPFKRRTLRKYQNKQISYFHAWNCKDRQKGRQGKGCRCAIWKEEDLLHEICRQLSWTQFDARCVEDLKLQIRVYDHTLEILRP